jgi:hypothetical protein
MFHRAGLPATSSWSTLRFSGLFFLPQELFIIIIIIIIIIIMFRKD